MQKHAQKWFTLSDRYHTGGMTADKTRAIHIAQGSADEEENQSVVLLNLRLVDLRHGIHEDELKQRQHTDPDVRKIPRDPCPLLQPRPAGSLDYRQWLLQ